MSPFDKLIGHTGEFDPEMWTRLLRAGLYLVAAQRADQVTAMMFADEATDVVLEALGKLQPIGAKANIDYEYTIDVMAALSQQVSRNPDPLLVAFAQATEAAAERRRRKETLQ